MPTIEECLPVTTRQYYLRVRNQKSSEAREGHREKLVSLRQKRAAIRPVVSGQQILVEWQLSEDFIGVQARCLLDAALETCSLYRVPLDDKLSNCIESHIREYVETQFQHALRTHSSSPDVTALSTNIKGVFSGRIPGAPVWNNESATDPP